MPTDAIYATCGLAFAAQYAVFTSLVVSAIKQGAAPGKCLLTFLVGSLVIALANGLLMAFLTIRAGAPSTRSTASTPSTNPSQTHAVTHVTAPTVNPTRPRSVLLPVKLSGPNFRAIVIGPIAIAVRKRKD